MLAIYKREVVSYLRSFIGFLFMAFLLFFVGLYFVAYNVAYGYPYLSMALSSSSFVFFIAVPVLTMKVLAEERKNKTDQLILTAPVSVGKIVLGKYLALVTLFAIPVLIICIYPLVLSAFGSVPMPEAYTAIFGFLLYGMTCLAIGLFVSSITESQVIAAVVGFAVLFVGYLMSGICSMISSTGNIVTKILSGYDLLSSFSQFMNGTFSLSSVVYFLSLIGFFLFLTTQSIQKRRWSISKNKITFGAFSTTSIVLVLGVVIVANLIMTKLPSQYTSFDITSNQLYSVGEETKEFLQGLQEDVTIYVMADEASQDNVLGETLKRYEQNSKHITVEYVNPVVSPNFYKQYTSESISSNSLIVVCGEKSRVIDYNQLYETEMDYTTYTTNVTGYDGEGQITSAISYVTNDNNAFVYVLDGHGGNGLEDVFKEGLTKMNLEVKELNLLQDDSISEESQFVIINSIQSDLSKDELTKLKEYLDIGGNVLITKAFLDEETDFTNLKELMKYYGLSLTEGIVTEANSGYYYQVPYFLLPDMYNNEFTKNIFNQFYLFFPYAQGIETEERDDISYETIVYSSNQSYSKIDFMNAESYDKAEGDIEGSFPLMVSASKETDDKESVMVLVGSEMVFTESANQMVSGANLKLFTNTADFFTEDMDTVSIPIKDYSISYLLISQRNVIILGIVFLIVLPLSLLATGFVVWFRRRKK